MNLLFLLLLLRYLLLRRRVDGTDRGAIGIKSPDAKDEDADEDEEG